MIQGTIAKYLYQLQELLIQISDTEFTRKLSLLNDATIGMHIRHILEFYYCLMAAKTTKIVAYDTRKRDVELETKPQKCISAIEEIICFVQKNNVDFPMKLNANYTMKKDENLAVTTTLYREFLYNIEHTIHHMAIIRIGIEALKTTTITVDENFGVAVSTIRNRILCVQ